MAKLIRSVSRFRQLFGRQGKERNLDDRFTDRLESLSLSAQSRLPNRRFY